jgi:cbb3-type cytochrome oxidase cytochrome c subunit
VRNGGSFKRAFISTNKAVTKHSNCQSDTDLILKGHQIYIHMGWRKFMPCHTQNVSILHQNKRQNEPE